MLFLETVDKARRNVCLIANLLRVVPGFVLFVSAHKNPNYQIQTYFWDRQLLALVVEISAQLEFFFSRNRSPISRAPSTFCVQALQTFGSSFGYQIWSPKLEPKIRFLLRFKCIFVFSVPIFGTKFGTQNWNQKKTFFQFSDVENPKKNVFAFFFLAPESFCDQ